MIEDAETSAELADREAREEYNRRRGDRRRDLQPILHEERRAEGRRRTPGLSALIGALFSRRL